MNFETFEQEIRLQTVLFYITVNKRLENKENNTCWTDKN